MSELVILTGQSGAGRSVAAGALVDFGWYVIDNLPTVLLSHIGSWIESGEAPDRLALVLTGMDAESKKAIADLKSVTDKVTVVFLESSADVLVARYESTKRRHPYGHVGTLGEAIKAERVALVETRMEADLLIDTTELNPHELRNRLSEQFDGSGAKMKVTVLSFGFKHGLPRDVDLVFDCRFLPNPYWVEGLRALKGTDKEVSEYVLEQDSALKFMANLDPLLDDLLPAYRSEGKSYLTLAFGCTGGHHRSVAVAESIASHLSEDDYDLRVVHRDIDR